MIIFKQRKKNKRSNNNLQCITHKLKHHGCTQVLRKGRDSFSTSDTRRVTLVINPVINHEGGKGRQVLTTSGIYRWSFVLQIFRKQQAKQIKSLEGSCRCLDHPCVTVQFDYSLHNFHNRQFGLVISQIFHSSIKPHSHI